MIMRRIDLVTEWLKNKDPEGMSMLKAAKNKVVEYQISAGVILVVLIALGYFA